MIDTDDGIPVSMNESVISASTTVLATVSNPSEVIWVFSGWSKGGQEAGWWPAAGVVNKPPDLDSTDGLGC